MNKKPSIFIFATSIIAIIILGTGIYFLLSYYNRESKLLVNVGGVTINKEQLSLQGLIYKQCYKNIDRDNVEILAGLIQNALQLSVLKNYYKTSPSNSTLEQKSKWINKNTKDSKILSCIKSVYGKNQQEYLYDIVLPTLVNPKLHKMFSADKKIQQKQKEQVENLMKEIKENPNILPTLAGYGKSEIINQQKNNSYIGGYEMSFGRNTFIKNILKKMKPGQLWPNIVEDNYSYRIIRLLKVSDKYYTYDGITIKKQDFDSWFKGYASKYIKIKIYNSNLKNEFIKKYPNLWWNKLLEK